MKKQKQVTKITEFEGYISGDYECFCLSKIPFKEWAKLNDMRKLSAKGIRKREEYLESVLLYPNTFFPEDAKDKKCRFKISVEVTILTEDSSVVSKCREEGKCIK